MTFLVCERNIEPVRDITIANFTCLIISIPREMSEEPEKPSFGNPFPTLLAKKGLKWD